MLLILPTCSFPGYWVETSWILSKLFHLEHLIHQGCKIRRNNQTSLQSATHISLHPPSRMFSSTCKFTMELIHCKRLFDKGSFTILQFPLLLQTVHLKASSLSWTVEQKLFSYLRLPFRAVLLTYLALYISDTSRSQNIKIIATYVSRTFVVSVLVLSLLTTISTSIWVVTTIYQLRADNATTSGGPIQPFNIFFSWFSNNNYSSVLTIRNATTSLPTSSLASIYPLTYVKTRFIKMQTRSVLPIRLRPSYIGSFAKENFISLPTAPHIDIEELRVVFGFEYSSESVITSPDVDSLPRLSASLAAHLSVSISQFATSFSLSPLTLFFNKNVFSPGRQLRFYSLPNPQPSTISLFFQRGLTTPPTHPFLTKKLHGFIYITHSGRPVFEEPTGFHEDLQYL